MLLIEKNNKSFVFVLIALGIFNFFSKYNTNKFYNVEILFVFLNYIFLIISLSVLLFDAKKIIYLLPFSCLLIKEFKIINIKFLFIDLIYFYLIFKIIIDMYTKKKIYIKFNNRILKILSFLFLVFLISSITEYLRPPVNKNFAVFLIFIKYIEYMTFPFIIIYLFRKNEKTLNSKKINFNFMLTIFLVGFYGIYSSKVFGRTTAPFEEIYEPNTLSGIMIIFIIYSLYQLINNKNIHLKIFNLYNFIQSSYVFIYTYSRTGYIAIFFVMIFAFFIIKKIKFKLLLLLFFILSFYFCSINVNINNRINSIFHGRNSFQLDVFIKTLNFRIPPSASARIYKYKIILNKIFPVYKIIGRGINGIGFVDGFFFKILGELGLIGLIFYIYFFYYLWKIIPSGKSFLKLIFIGLIIHSLFVNTFLIYRIIIPFYIVLILYSKPLNLKKQF